MISDELKTLILPYLRLHLPFEDDTEENLNVIFSKCYQVESEVGKLITVKPLGSNPVAMQFFEINGAFAGIEDWEYAKKIGKKV